MKGTVIIVRPDGQITGADFERALQLDDLKQATGNGSVEVVPFFDSVDFAGRVMLCAAFCDEDGKRKGLPINQIAIDMWERALERSGRQGVEGRDYLVGDIAVVIGDDEFLAAL